MMNGTNFSAAPVPSYLEMPRAVAQSSYSAVVSPLRVFPLTEHDKDEVLIFLLEQINNTFGMIGFIRNNGVVSPHNRGTFYGCRNSEGELEGVALIGHATLIEARSNAAIEAFARVAKTHSDLYMLFGEQETVTTFWHYYSDGGQRMRLHCRELLFKQAGPVAAQEAVTGLRLATIDDLDLIVPVHARTAFEESGINPLEVDPEGFRRRCARRIEQGKSWVWVDGGKLIFKAEVVTDSPEVIYLEGIDVHPQERGKGYGLRCLSRLGSILLERTCSMVLLVNDKNKAAQKFYEKAGWGLIGYYDTIFLKQEVY